MHGYFFTYMMHRDISFLIRIHDLKLFLVFIKNYADMASCLLSFGMEVNCHLDGPDVTSQYPSDSMLWWRQNRSQRSHEEEHFCRGYEYACSPSLCLQSSKITKQ
jgi:hypothetical protein